MNRSGFEDVDIGDERLKLSSSSPCVKLVIRVLHCTWHNPLRVQVRTSQGRRLVVVPVFAMLQGGL